MISTSKKFSANRTLMEGLCATCVVACDVIAGSWRACTLYMLRMSPSRLYDPSEYFL